MPIIGGTVDVADPAVVEVVIAGGQCSGVAVAPRVVVTAAHCAQPGPGGTAGGATIVETWIDRYADGSVGHDLAAVRLDRDLPSYVSISDPVAGAHVRLVGFGADEVGMRGVKRTVDAVIGAVTTRTMLAGMSGATTCTGDSGGAALDDDGSLVGVVSAGDDACDATAQLVRPDSEPQLAQVIAAWSGVPQDPCGFDGTCIASCPRVDLDCPLGGAAGDSCGAATDCESRACTVAPEGDAQFCSAACAVDADCPAPLGRCVALACVYLGPTPGVAGQGCTDDDDCRSGLCDLSAGVCTTPCSSDGCPADLSCEPVRDTHACTNAPGCNAIGDPSLAVFGLLLLRRRRRS